MWERENVCLRIYGAKTRKRDPQGSDNFYFVCCRYWNRNLMIWFVVKHTTICVTVKSIIGTLESYMDINKTTYFAVNERLQSLMSLVRISTSNKNKLRNISWLMKTPAFIRLNLFWLSLFLFKILTLYGAGFEVWINIFPFISHRYFDNTEHSLHFIWDICFFGKWFFFFCGSVLKIWPM